jgi:hypothetical protein
MSFFAGLVAIAIGWPIWCFIRSRNAPLMIDLIELEPGAYYPRQELQRRQWGLFWHSLRMLGIGIAVILTLELLGIH